MRRAGAVYEEGRVTLLVVASAAVQVCGPSNEPLRMRTERSVTVGGVSCCRNGRLQMFRRHAATKETECVVHGT
jgi:hypothetical protein